MSFRVSLKPGFPSLTRVMNYGGGDVMATLKFIYDKLIAGEIFGKIEQHRLGGTYFWEVLSSDDKYIHWRHYGSSANRLSLTGLRWILTEIFEMTPEEFLYEYTTYNEWKRIKKIYELRDIGQC